MWTHGYSESGSTGLGLSFVQQVVDLHHGTIEVKSSPENIQGSRSPCLKIKESTMGKNILSIDDDEDILYTIQEIILHQGWTPLLARNFREAEHILTQYGNGSWI